MTDDFLSDEDKALFREQMRLVKPLKKSVNKIQKKTTAPAPRKIVRTEQDHSRPKMTKNYYLSDYISEPVQSHSVLSYCLPSLPSKRFKALRQGQIPWEARLDLHGLQTEKAKEALCRFIQNQAEQQKRCLLIIHGKGGQEGGTPLIKNLVNRWLPQMDEILAFHSALAKDGGHGALYVLLKKYQ